MSDPVSFASDSFVHGLEPSSCVDAVHPDNNNWDIAVIEKFSEFRTEFEVVFSDGKGICIFV